MKHLKYILDENRQYTVYLTTFITKINKIIKYDIDKDSSSMKANRSNVQVYIQYISGSQPVGRDHRLWSVPKLFWGGPQMINLMCNIVFSLNSKESNSKFKCIEGICTFLK